MKKLQLIAIIILASVLSVHGRQVNLKNLKLYDKKDRQITLHGTNIVVKVPPYIPSTGPYDPSWSFGPQDIASLKQNGFNAIRLGIMWAGAQPKKDWFNQTYFQEMVKIVNAAGQAGIYSLVEFHQDLLSQSFCGDGVPKWLIDQIKGYKTFPFPMGKKIKLNQSGLPDWKDCDTQNWGKYYFSYDVGQGMNDLYSSTHKLNQKFIAYWEKIATTFKNNPYVIAYELINEPFIGNFWRDPLLVVPSMAERLKLQSFYDRLSEKIRKIDSQTPICFEPVTFDNFVPTGFSHAPGGKRYSNQSIFCYHHYQPPALNITSLDTYVKDAKKLGIASILSETFGSYQVLDRAQYWKQSWMYWIYKDFGKNWGSMKAVNNSTKTHTLDSLLKNQQADGADRLIRTYFQRVDGQLESSSFNPATGHFSGTYWGKANGQTILFLNKEKTYANSFQINIYPQNQIQVLEDGNFVTLRYLGKQSHKKILVSVTRL